jgi:hypothetical protein
VIAGIAAIDSGGWESPGQLQVGQVLHLHAARCAFEGRGLWLTTLRHGRNLYSKSELRQQPAGRSVVIRAYSAVPVGIGYTEPRPVGSSIRSRPDL